MVELSCVANIKSAEAASSSRLLSCDGVKEQTCAESV
ncbi:hypothetical protein R3I94_015680 [Phoxinus phoxinus]|uniref:Uncharacterized protein n=1 Tax=Phoxinus phoxinus TaxID=58324 RepID=A0AAN9H4X6_9TELE